MTTQENQTGALAVGGWGERPSPAVQAALVMVSAALLLLEISLTRFFSFTTSRTTSTRSRQS